jgi:hypothetical protein
MPRPRGSGGRYETLAIDDHDFHDLQSVLTSDQLDLSSNNNITGQQGHRAGDSLLQKRPSTQPDDQDEDYGDDDDSDDSDVYIYSSSDDDGDGSNEKDYLPTSRRRRSNRGPYIETPMVRTHALCSAVIN